MYSLFHPRSWLPYFPALVSGLLLTLCFPDPGLHYLAFVALCPLIISLAPMTVRQSFLAGFAAGFVHFTTLIYWIVPTLSTFGGLHILLSVCALALLCLYLALYPALFAWGLKKLAPSPAIMPLAGACLWTGLEFVRTHLFTGFPWGILGYSQFADRFLVQMADVTGVLGISFVLVLCNTLISTVWIQITTNGSIMGRHLFLRLYLCVSYTFFILAAAYVYGILRIPLVTQQMAAAPKPVFAVVQGNIRQDLKWSRAFRRTTIEKYGSMSLEAARFTPDLIIWPETALPFYYGHDLDLSNQVDRYVRRAKTHFLMGSPAVETSGDQVRYFNRVFMLNQLSIPVGTYDKTHLVPFGEYIPFQELLFFLEKLTQQAGNFSQGESGFVPLGFKQHKTGILICFEILFPSISRQFVKNGADILTTVTNDAWFGTTSAPAQHFSIAVLRAVENRRSVVRAANTGISGFIDPIGQVFAATRLFTDAMVVHSLPALKSASFYTRHGDLPGFACLIAISMGFMVKGTEYIKRRFQP